jgi:transcriptional regulator with XRE-family HTH domain
MTTLGSPAHSVLAPSVPSTVPTAVPSATPTATPTAVPPAAAARAAASARRRELGAFLRSRRERLAPADVGLPEGGRRRTPGLRREEVASLAGVGMTWYTWLEQGRDIHASEQVLDAIARTLMLDPHECRHLFTLAGVAAPRQDADSEVVSPEIRAVLDQLHPYPAFVTNERYDLLAYNRAYLALLGDLDALPFEDRNSVWIMFTKQTTSRCFVDRDTAKPRMVAQLRGAMAEHVADPAWKCLVKRLQHASAEFRELWERHEVAEPENARKRLLHRDLGLLQFNYLNTWLAPRAGLRLVAYIPADDATREATREFDRLQPGRIE